MIPRTRASPISARALTYSGAGRDALPHLERAVAAKYPQALFVTGYVMLDGQAGIAADPCRAAACNDLQREPAHLRSMLATARGGRLDFYQGLLVTALERELR